MTGITYRHPSVPAAEAVTVDHVSGGRLELGVGAPWFEQEHGALGIPFPPAGEGPLGCGAADPVGET